MDLLHVPMLHAEALLAVRDDAQIVRSVVRLEDLALLPLAIPHARVVRIASRHQHALRWLLL
eukprot:scaffold71713_cov33-Phaeocystis_antarctica.AAC.2